MDDLQQIQAELSTIKKICVKLLNRGIDVLKAISDDDTTKVMEANRKLTEDDAYRIIGEVVTNVMLKDARVINDEINKFAKELIQDKPIENYEAEFLAEVWSGDIYGSSGIDGLKKLRGDLQEQLRSFDVDEVIDRTITSSLL